METAVAPPKGTKWKYKKTSTTVTNGRAGDGFAMFCVGRFDLSYLESHTVVGNICGGASDSEMGAGPDRHFRSYRT